MNKQSIHTSLSQEQLEAYLDGTLNEKETQELDALLNNDPKLQWMVDEYVRQQMESNNEDLQHPKTRIRPFVPYFRYVAAVMVCLLISGAIYLYFRESTNISNMQNSAPMAPCSMHNTYMSPIDSNQLNDTTLYKK